MRAIDRLTEEEIVVGVFLCLNEGAGLQTEIKTYEQYKQYKRWSTDPMELRRYVDWLFNPVCNFLYEIKMLFLIFFRSF